MSADVFHNLLEAIRIGTPDLHDAACKGRGGMFDLRDPTDPDRAEAEAEALGVCNECSAYQQCEQWYLSTPPSRRPHGVIAGRINRPPPPRSKQPKRKAS